MSLLGRIRYGIYRVLVRPILAPMVRDVVLSDPDFRRPRMVYGLRDADGTLRPDSRMSDSVTVYRPENVRIGDHVFVWHHSILDGTAGIEIGEGCQIGAWVGIFSHSSHVAIRLYGRHYADVPETEKAGYHRAPVKIGRFVFVGSGAAILPGVSIGDGAVVGAGAIVSKDVPAYAIVSGNPAKVVGDARTLDKFHLAAPGLDPRVAEWHRDWQEP